MRLSGGENYNFERSGKPPGIHFGRPGAFWSSGLLGFPGAQFSLIGASWSSGLLESPGVHLEPAGASWTSFWASWSLLELILDLLGPPVDNFKVAGISWGSF